MRCPLERWFVPLSVLGLIACGSGGGGSADPGFDTGREVGEDTTLATDLPPIDQDGEAEDTTREIVPPDSDAAGQEDPGVPQDLPGETTADPGEDAAGGDAATPEVDTGCFEACHVENAFGICRGTQRCGEPDSCDAPVPGREICNGLDDDCDGVVDEGDLCGEDGLVCTNAVCGGPSGCEQVVVPGWCVIDGECHRRGALRPDNSCEVCVPDAQGGGWWPREGACEDGDLCTVGDHCEDGACRSGTNVCACSSNADCQQYEDGDLCNGTLVCDLNRVPHVCVVDPATVVRCDPSEDRPCFANQCDPATGTCGMAPANEGRACNDQDPCTTADRCVAGECRGTAYDCDDGLPCTLDLCDGQGGCSHELAPYFCLIPGPGGIPICVEEGESPPDDPCRVCDPRRNPGEWVFTTLACDDEDPCTADDHCADGRCVGTPYECDDGLDCTVESCDGQGGCIQSVLDGFCLIDGACYAQDALHPLHACLSCDAQVDPWSWTPHDGPCDDGNPCTVDDVCRLGTCTGGALRNCDDQNLCTDDSCDPLVPDGCVHLPNTNPCDDGNLCTVGDRCRNGVCEPGPLSLCECESDDDCPDDGNLCNGTTVCDRSVLPHRCVVDPATVVTCDPSGNTFCLENRCEPSTGQCSLTPVREGDPCDDANPCTYSDRCENGVCVGIGYSCNDGLDCTEDLCQGAGSCGATLKPGFCLIDGRCVGEGPHPENPCLVCDPQRQAYAWSLAADGIPCDDGQACTYGDVCSQGQCRGSPYGCDDGLPCTQDRCLGDGGCAHDLLPGFCRIAGTCRLEGESPDPCRVCDPAQNPDGWTIQVGVACDDGNPCSYQDECQPFTGRCLGMLYDCDDGLFCTTDTCLGDGTCAHEVVSWACLIDGVCRGHGERHPQTLCQVCFPPQSRTTWTPMPDGSPCSDDDECTVNDKCQDGLCVAGPARNCDDLNPCTGDTCDPNLGCLNPPNDRYLSDLDAPVGFEFRNSHPVVGWQWVPDSPLGNGGAIYYGDLLLRTYSTGPEANRGEALMEPWIRLGQGDPAVLSFDLWLENEWSGWFETLGEGRIWGADELNVYLEFPSEERVLVWSSSGSNIPWWRQDRRGWPIGPKAVRIRTGDLGSMLQWYQYPPFRLVFEFRTGDDRWNDFEGPYIDRIVVGNPCDDGDACTVNETCQAGSCLGLPQDCDDGNACVIKVCDRQWGCVIQQVVEDDRPCNDWDRCTENDACIPYSGWCSGSPVSCPDDGNECTNDYCDGLMGCVYQPVPDFQVSCGNDGMCVGGQCLRWVEDPIYLLGNESTAFWGADRNSGTGTVFIAGQSDYLPRVFSLSSSGVSIEAQLPPTIGEFTDVSNRVVVGRRYDPLLGHMGPAVGTWYPDTGWDFQPNRNPPLLPGGSFQEPLMLYRVHWWRERDLYLIAGDGRAEGVLPYLLACSWDAQGDAWQSCRRLDVFLRGEPYCERFQQIHLDALWATPSRAWIGGYGSDAWGIPYYFILASEIQPAYVCGQWSWGVFTPETPESILVSEPGSILDIGGTEGNLWSVASDGRILFHNGSFWQTIHPMDFGLPWNPSTDVLLATFVEGNQVHFVGNRHLGWSQPTWPFYIHGWSHPRFGPTLDYRKDFYFVPQPWSPSEERFGRDILRDPVSGDLILLGWQYSSYPYGGGLIYRLRP